MTKHINSKAILLSASTLISLIPFAKIVAQKNETEKRPNIIFIMSDDHAYQAISAYKDRFENIAPTPNIDRIANQGMRFDRCYVTNSLSGPSRATILTGKYSHINGFVQNDGLQFDGSQETFPKLLKEAGYQTAIIGKWHLGSIPTGFNYWEILDDQGQYYNPDFINKTGKHQEHGYVTDLISNKSIAWLKEVKKNGNPFMLMIHHKAPHREWEPNLKYLKKFKGVNFPEPSTLFDDYSGRGIAVHTQDMTIDKTMNLESDLKMWKKQTSKEYNRTRGRMDSLQGYEWDNYYDSVKFDFNGKNLKDKDLIRWKYQRYMNDYLACIQSVDESVGEVLDYLRRSGLDKNTIVVYTSDQGFYLGEHGWFDKRFMYNESLRTPLLISWPSVIEPGITNKDMVSNLDFAETFLDAAGLKVPDNMQGISLVPILKGKTPTNWRKEHYYEYFEFPGSHRVKRHYGITTERYKLIHFYYDIDEWELYDLKADPNEMKNVYNDSKYTKVKYDLNKRLIMLRIKYKDTDELMKGFLPRKK